MTCLSPVCPTVLLFHPGFQNELGGDPVHAAFFQRPIAPPLEQTCPRIRGGEPLVLELHLFAEAAVQPVAEFAGPHRDLLLGAVHVERQADNQQIRLPLLEQLVDVVPVGDAVVGLDGAQGLGRAGKLLTDGHPYAFGAVVKAHDTA